MDKKQINESLNFIFNEGKKWDKVKEVWKDKQDKVWDKAKKVWVKNKEKIKVGGALIGSSIAAYQVGKYGAKGFKNRIKNNWEKRMKDK